MKRRPFPIGALVVNTGRLRGQGYIWRVEGYRPMWTGTDWDESRQPERRPKTLDMLEDISA